jgi:transposase-like protein
VTVPRKYRQFSSEFKDEAVRLVIEASRPIVQVARELGINEGTLGNWVNRYRAEHADDEPPLNVSERARLREAERELRELRMENEFLKKVIMPPAHLWRVPPIQRPDLLRRPAQHTRRPVPEV